MDKYYFELTCNTRIMDVSVARIPFTLEPSSLLVRKKLNYSKKD